MNHRLKASTQKIAGLSDPLALTLSVLLALLIVGLVLFSADLNLESFEHRTIGIIVVKAVDVNARTGLYFISVAIFISIVFGGSLIFTSLLERLDRSPWRRYVVVERKVLFLLAAFTCLVLLLCAGSEFQEYWAESILLISLIFLVLFVVLLKLVSLWQGWQLHRLFTSYSINVLALIFPILIFYLVWYFLGIQSLIEPIYIPWYLGLWAAFYAIYGLLRRLAQSRHISVYRLDSALQRAGVCALILPLVFPFATEVHYALLGVVAITYRTLCTIFVIALLILGGLAFWRTLSGTRPGVRRSKMIVNVYFPLFIFVNAVLVYYKADILFPSFDTFHYGERLISAQQLFQYYRIPFIDLYPTHGMSDVLIDILYYAVNGYRMFEPYVWQWIYQVLMFVPMYFLLKQMMAPLSALLIVWLLPATRVFDIFYAVFLIEVLIIIYVWRRPSTRRYWLMWASVLCLVIFRVDFGIAALAGVGFILGIQALVFMLDRDRAALKQMLVYNLVPAFVLFGGMIAVFWALAALRGVSFREIMDQVTMFITFQGVTMGKPEIYTEFSWVVLLRYLVLPLIGVIVLLWFLYQRVVMKNQVPFFGYGLTFLAVASLVLFARAFQGHVSHPLYTTVLFAFLAFLLPYLVKKISPGAALLISLGVFAAYWVLFPGGRSLVSKGNYLLLASFDQKGERASYDLTPYENFLGFLEDNLGDDQTFYDFTNSPLLYILSGREFLPYLIPNLYHTSDVIQDIALEKLEKAWGEAHLPIVVFKQDSQFWDNMDGVPNEVRSYRIAEYIYRHYEPLGIIPAAHLNYQVWLDKRIDPSRLGNLEKYGLIEIDGIRQDFSLGLLPYLWGTFDEKDAAKTTEVLQVLKEKPISLQAGKPRIFAVDPSLNRESGNYLDLRVKSRKPGSITIVYGEDGESRFSFDIIGSDQYETYLVRLSSQWQWMAEKISELAIESSNNIQIDSIAIRKGD